jgi:uncharacterized protein YjbI with pentapeptide repeats
MAFFFKRAVAARVLDDPSTPADASPALESTHKLAPPANPRPPESAPGDDAMLKDFLIKNFLSDEPEKSEQAEKPRQPEKSEQPEKPSQPDKEFKPTEIPTPVAAIPEPATYENAVLGPLTQEGVLDSGVSEPLSTPEQIIAHSIALETSSLTQPENHTATDAEFLAAHAAEEPSKIDIGEWALEEKLANHKEWLDSHATTGAKADFQNAQLEGKELIGVNLRYADLQDANLKSSDLLLADLRDACLVRANLQESCLVGANLEGANLEGASLDSAMGLLPRQLCGANLHEASLPAPILEFNALADFARTSLTASRLFSTMLVFSVVSCLTIWKTKDIQLLSDSAIIPYLHSSSAAAALPTDEIYLIAPAAMLAIFLLFLYHLQRVWDAVLELPAIFPDGRILGQKSPKIITGLLRTHFRWMNPDAPSTRAIEKTISVLLAYWTVPLVLLFFWGRYLTLQEIHGTILQEILILISVAVALYCTMNVGRPAEQWVLQGKPAKNLLARLHHLKPASILISLFVLLTFLSVGTIAGVPHDAQRSPQFGPANIRRWAPAILWSVGYDPYAELTESSISARPAQWSGSDDQVSSVTGAHLNGTNFRYSQGYGIFLANAHLFRSNFQGAFLSEADFRAADLGQANLKFAVLDRAQMSHANLDRANLDGANMSRVDLRGANLSYSSLAGALLVDARLDGASFYGSHAENVSLIRGNLEKTDFREARLDGATLESADLQQAYMWSAKLPGANLRNAQLATAILIDADLQGADLRGAHLSGTVLNGANLQDVNLDGADLRGALQISAYQICSAKSRRGAQLDDTLQTQVDAQCGTPHQP